jgi:hypothetical protein
VRGRNFSRVLRMLRLSLLLIYLQSLKLPIQHYSSGIRNVVLHSSANKNLESGPRFISNVGEMCDSHSI